jgi:hypothetical protein
LGQQKKSDSAAGRQSKRPLRKRQAGDIARLQCIREHPPLIPTFSPKGRRSKVETPAA